MTHDRRNVLASIARRLTPGIAKLITGVRARWRGCAPTGEQRIYYANHTSHGDFILIWSALPRRLRETTRPVAGIDYWNQGALRKFIGSRVFNTVLIDRTPKNISRKWLSQMQAALQEGSSLIVFPEGTRNTTDKPLLAFKGGIYNLARGHPNVDLVPVWVENVGRVLPKGDFLPVPLLCSASFGAPIRLEAGETRSDFLQRARDALAALAPENGGPS